VKAIIVSKTFNTRGDPMKFKDHETNQFLSSAKRKLTMVASGLILFSLNACNVAPLPLEAKIKELKLTENEVVIKITGLIVPVVLERSPAENNFQKIADVSNGRFEDKGLTKNTVYKYRLRAGDSLSPVLNSGTTGPGQVVEYPE
jgi:hypothetical protein